MKNPAAKYFSYPLTPFISLAIFLSRWSFLYSQHSIKCLQLTRTLLYYLVWHLTLLAILSGCHLHADFAYCRLFGLSTPAPAYMPLFWYLTISLTLIDFFHTHTKSINVMKLYTWYSTQSYYTTKAKPHLILISWVGIETFHERLRRAGIIILQQTICIHT